MIDFITLPREVAQDAVEALERVSYNSELPGWPEIVEALRAYLAAPKQEPQDWLITDNTFTSTPPAPYADWPAFFAEIIRTRTIRGLRIGTALVAPPEDKTHPGYVIGSHWLETAYSRICAGEAEADVLRDMGWERVDEALRRDAERYRWLKMRVEDYDGHACFPQVPYPAPIPDRSPFDAVDAAIDAAMGEKR